MDWPEIERRIAAGESETTEFKRGADMKQIGPALCAMANGVGGVIILGVSDDGEVVGVTEPPERVSERLTDFLQSGLSSPVMASLGRHAHHAGGSHWIEVVRQRGLRPLEFGGRTYVRRGRASVAPAPPELQELYNSFGFVLTEEQGVWGSRASSIDREAFVNYLAALGIDLDIEPALPLDADLRSRGVLVDVAGEEVCTLYGLLAFGRDPQAYGPTRNLFIDCVAYAGVDRAAEVLLSGEARGRLDEQVTRTLGWMAALGRSERFDGVLREDIPRIPNRALREALVNAVAHRDYAIVGSRVMLEVYDDRVDVTSPGLLPNHMSPESVRAGGLPRSRNESIANYCVVRRLMEKRGRGWMVMKQAMRAHNGTEPELHVDHGGAFVRVTFRTPPPNRAR